MQKARIIPEVYFSFNDHPFRKPSFALYFCGCYHKCKGCHSQELQDFNNPLCQSICSNDLFKIIDYYYKHYKKYIKGLVLLGGDPVVYTEFLKEFLQLVKKYCLVEVVLYTGYLFEEIDDELKSLVDIVIDGKYIEQLKTNKFPASANQRVFLKENDNVWKDITHLFLQ